MTLIFSATAVTPGYFLREVNLFGGGDARVHTVSMGASGAVRFHRQRLYKDKQELLSTCKSFLSHFHFLF